MNKAGAANAASVKMDEEGKALEKELTQLKNRQKRAENQPDEVRWAAVRHLRTVIEPRLKSTGKPMAPISSLDGTAKAALATFFLTDLWKSISDRIVNPAPGYIQHFEDGIIVGGQKTELPGVPRADGSGERRGFTVSFYYRTEDGNLKDGGLTFTTYSPQAK